MVINEVTLLPPERYLLNNKIAQHNAYNILKHRWVTYNNEHLLTIMAFKAAKESYSNGQLEL